MTCLRHLRFCLSILMLLVCSATVAQDEAALLAPVSAPPVVPGKQWVVDIAALDQQRAMRVMLERSPVGVELQATETGWTLRWDSPERLSPTTRIVVLAVDVKKPTLRQRVELQLTRAQSREAAKPAPGLAPEPSPQLSAQSPTVGAIEQSEPTGPSLSPLAFPALSPKTLTAEHLFSLWFRVEGLEPDEMAGVEIVKGPDGVSVKQGFAAWHAIEWLPTDEQLGRHELELLATSERDPMRQVITSVRLTVAPSGTQTVVSSRPVTDAPESSPSSQPSDLPFELPLELPPELRPELSPEIPPDRASRTVQGEA